MIRKYLDLLINELRQSKSYRITSQTFIIRLLGLCLIFFNQVLLARLMGAKGYGNYTVIFTWLNFLAVFSLFGFDTSMLRFYPSLSASQQWGKMKGFLRFTKRMVWVLSILSSLAILLLLLYRSNRYSISFSEALFWAVMLLPFLVFIHYYSAVLRVLHKLKTSLMPFYFLLPVSVSVACYLYYVFNNELLKVDAAVFIYLCCAIFVFFFISVKVKSRLRKTVYDAQPEYERKKWLTVSFTMLVISTMTLALKRLDILFVSYYYGNTHAGIYAVAAMVSSFVPFGLTVAEYVFTPRISELFESNEHEKLQHMMTNATRIILIITVPVAFVTIVFGKFILRIFGTAFIASYLPLIILTAGQLVNACTGMVASAMLMTGKHRLFLSLYVIAGMLDVLLNFALVPTMGMVGAAMASSISLAALNVVMYLIVKKKLRIKVSAFIF